MTAAVRRALVSGGQWLGGGTPARAAASVWRHTHGRLRTAHRPRRPGLLTGRTGLRTRRTAASTPRARQRTRRTPLLARRARLLTRRTGVPARRARLLTRRAAARTGPDVLRRGRKWRAGVGGSYRATQRACR
ncbi:hypothetical protein PJI17_17910 [Mycobacterium kansasii]